jgi:hypothetical protein
MPLWAQFLNFALTILLGILKFVEFLRRGRLEIRVTRDCFFRITDFGEQLFIHGVLLARDGPVLILNVSATLRRLASSQATTLKSFPLEIVNHGEKVKGQAYTAEHHFYGASPLLYVTGTSTQRVVYHCQLAEYKERQRQATSEFTQDLMKFKEENSQVTLAGGPKPRAEIIKELTQKVNLQHNLFCGLIQIEAGEYELSVKVEYEKGGFIAWQRHAESQSYIYFTVDSQDIAKYKADLLGTVKTMADNVVNGTTNLPIFPELRLTNFFETPARSKTIRGEVVK